MAPEVLSNTSGGYNLTADSWSLGVMVFIMYVNVLIRPQDALITSFCLRLTKEEPFYDDSHQGVDWSRLSEYGLSIDGEILVLL